jgi:hypothetical protein
MSKPALTLGLLCIALACIDVKLLFDLRANREARTSATAAATGSVPQRMPGPMENRDAGTGIGRPAATLSEFAATRAQPNPQLQADDADFLHMYADPRLRQQLIDETALDLRKRHRGAARSLGIEVDRLRMLGQRLAVAEVEWRARRLRCGGDAACLREVLAADPADEKARMAREILGNAKAEEFKQFQDTLNERRAVEGLQARLPHAPLTTERTDALIRALSGESMRMREEWRKSGGANAFGTSELGMVFYPRTATSIEQQVAAAKDYSQRMRHSVSGLLTAEQRAEFDAMQDDLLRSFERWRRRNPG